jgi:DNA repair protein RadA
MVIERSIEDIRGIGQAIASKLRTAGYGTVESLAATPIREITDKTGLGYDTVRRICEEARSVINTEFITANELYKQRQQAMKLTTGSKNLNSLLGGGVETQAITELVGEFSTGKSQICMKLAVTVQLPSKDGGLGGSALFMDTEGTFSPERVYQIAKSMGMDPEKVLENIIYARCFNSDHQMILLDHTSKIIKEENVKLVVVDSVISHFRGEYVGRETLSERQQKLNMYMHKLLRLAEVYNVAVVVTNQCQANPQAFFGDPNRPAGGNILAHASTHRVYLHKCKGNTRSAKIIDSPSLPESKTRFQITEMGIEDCAVEGEEEE